LLSWRHGAADHPTLPARPFHAVGFAAFRVPRPGWFSLACHDYIDEFLDLNKKLITNKNATFLARAEGNSMKGAGSFPATC